MTALQQRHCNILCVYAAVATNPQRRPQHRAIIQRRSRFGEWNLQEQPYVGSKEHLSTGHAGLAASSMVWACADAKADGSAQGCIQGTALLHAKSWVPGLVQQQLALSGSSWVLQGRWV